MRSICKEDLQDARNIADTLSTSPLTAVPIILTSAVKGDGINKLHAFLRQLPIPLSTETLLKPEPTNLFHIEDVYSIQKRTSSDRSAVIGGYVRHGSLNVGDELLLGPYPVDTSPDDSDSGSGRPSRASAIPQSRSFPGALNKTHARNASQSDRHTEWRRVRITSLRNLRLPVRTLHADQVGTMCIVPIDTPIVSPSINRIRKGMVLADRQPTASKVITVRFEGAQTAAARSLSVGSAVVVYIASVRASSKVISVATGPGATLEASVVEDEDSFGFGFDDEAVEGVQDDGSAATTVTFQFIAAREFVELGAKMLVMPGGGPGLSSGGERGAKGLAGLEGFVGRVVEE